MRRLDDVLAEVHLSRAEVEAWIRDEWLRPARSGETYLFDEADVARCRLIGELRRDLSMDDEAIPVILSLLDQIYALRHALSGLQDALHNASREAREEVAACLRRNAGG
jgi:chaperone modulatory protein CbpM